MKVTAPCTTSYLRKELIEMAKECKIKKYYAMSKADLCKHIELHNTYTNTPIASPKDTVEQCIAAFLQEYPGNKKERTRALINILRKHHVDTPFDVTMVTGPKNKPHNVSPLMDRHKAFVDYFQYDLIGFLHDSDELPIFRADIPGGYGLKMILEHKYGIKNVIETNDIDITLSTHNSLLTPDQALQHLLKKSKAFISTRPDSEKFTIKSIDMKGAYNAVLGFNRYHILTIMYENDEFVDILITDKVITPEQMNITLSKQCLLPIKREALMLKEYFYLIYRENVRRVDPYTYWKRNPVDGKLPEKGIKDIERVKLLCNAATHVKFMRKYCQIMQGVTIEQLRTMSKGERDRIFSKLRNVVN